MCDLGSKGLNDSLVNTQFLIWLCYATVANDFMLREHKEVANLSFINLTALKHFLSNSIRLCPS